MERDPFRWSFGALSAHGASGSSGSGRAATLVRQLPPGAQVYGGRYLVEGELGRGGMGVVFRARDLEDDRPVAIKVVAKALDETRRARFAREGELTAALDHPHLVRVHGGGLRADDRPFLVMELVDGARELDEVLDAATRDEGLQLLEQVARAVGAAHAQGIVHRDLKFGNVLVDADDQPKVCDFGLAWRADLEKLTQTGALVGTPMFMAPEQTGVGVDRGASFGPPTDVWALGVMLYRFLSGRYPFDRASLITLVQAIHDDDPFPLQGLEPVSPALEAVCRRALAKAPEARFPDGAAFADALQAAQRAPWRRRRWPWALGLVAAAVVTGAALGLRDPDGAAAPADPPNAPSALAPLDARALLAEARRLARTGGPAPALFARLTRALEAARGDAALEPQAQLELVRAALERGHYARGLDASATLRDHPELGREARFLRAWLLLKLERQREGVAALRPLADRDDRWGLLARGTLAHRERTDLRPVATQLRERFPRDPYAALVRNQLAVGRQDFAGALQQLREVDAPRPDIHLLGSRVLLLHALDRPPREIRPLLERATALAAPATPLILDSCWSRQLLTEGDEAGALVHLRRRAKRLRDPGALIVLGVELERAGALPEAHAAWRKSLDLGGAAQRRQVEGFSLPLRLRILRGAGLPLVPAPLTAPTQAWVEEQVRVLPAAVRDEARDLLERCVKGFGWGRLRPAVARLKERAPTSAALASFLARVELSRDQIADARASLARAQRLGADPGRIALRDAFVRARCSGIQGVASTLRAVAQRDTPPGWMAQATLDWLVNDHGRALERLGRVLQAPDPPQEARFLHVVTLMASGRRDEAGRVSTEYFTQTRCADRWMLAARAQQEIVAARARPDPRQLQRMFWALEMEMGVSSDRGCRLDAAEEAFLQGPTSPWFPSAEVWLREAEASTFPAASPRKETLAGRLRAVQGLALLANGGAADAVERRWRGLRRNHHVRPRARRRFEGRFGRPPRGLVD